MTESSVTAIPTKTKFLIFGVFAGAMTILVTSISLLLTVVSGPAAIIACGLAIVVSAPIVLRTSLMLLAVVLGQSKLLAIGEAAQARNDAISAKATSPARPRANWIKLSLIVYAVFAGLALVPLYNVGPLQFQVLVGLVMTFVGLGAFFCTAATVIAFVKTSGATN